VPPASPPRIDPEQIPAGGRKRMAALRPAISNGDAPRSRAIKVECNCRSRSRNPTGQGCDVKIFCKFSDLTVSQITLLGMTSVEFNNAFETYLKKTASIFYDAAVYTYDGEYGSFKSTLRSTKCLGNYILDVG
jgi:hypothetical protein